MPLSLRDVLDLHETSADSFQAPAAFGGDRLFGGYLLGQAFVAAMRTVGDDRSANSIHASFLRAGVRDIPLTLDVSRIRDGGSFSSRAVSMHQDGRGLLRATVSMHTGEDGEQWQRELDPPLCTPEQAHELDDTRKFNVMGDVDIRSVRQWNGKGVLHPYWLRLRTDLGDAAYLQQAALLTFSDLVVIRAARAIEAPGAENAAMSLDHTLWFHRSPRMADWQYVDVAPAINAHGRALTEGKISDTDGRLIATFNQEVLLRMPRRATSA